MQDSLASDGDSETSTSSSSESEEEQQQGDLVVLGFDRLRENYDPYKYHDYAHMLPYRWGKDKVFHPDELDMRKDISNRLRSNLLPQLRQQLSILSEFLDPTRLQIESELTLELISENQSELDTTLHEIEDALNNLRSESDSLVIPSEREDDGNLKEFKGFRMIGLDKRFGDLLQATTSVFRQSQKLIRKLELSTQDSHTPSSYTPDMDESQSSAADIAWIREQITDSTRSSDEAARCMIEWIEGSDTQLIQYFWNHSLCFIDRRMRVLLKMIEKNSKETMEDPARNDDDSDALTYSSSESEQEQQQGVYAKTMIRTGIWEYARPLPHRWSKDEGFQPHELDLRKEFLKQLRSSLLPLLREQITSLSHLLDPTRLQIESESTLELILEKQSELDTTLHQIEDALSSLRSESDPLVEFSEREDDGHLKEFKGFRMIGLDNRFGDLLQATTSVFKQSQKLIRKLELSTQDSQSSSSDSDSEEYQSFPAAIALLQKQIINSTSCSYKAAQTMIEWIEGYDTQLIQYFWNHSLCFIDRRMRVLLKMIEKNFKETMQDSLASDGDSDALTWSSSGSEQEQQQGAKSLEHLQIWSSKGLQGFAKIIIPGKYHEDHSEESQSSPTDIASIRKQIIDSASSSSVAAGCMIKWIEGSDIQLVQSNWSYSSMRKWKSS
ncbi:hypothetical protein PSHT_03535, partial [Puccinia striiformis]